jgi:cysteine-rich repeat protein
MVMVTVRSRCLVALLAAAPACGSRRIAGHLDDLDDCSAATSETLAPGTTESSGASEASDSLGSGEGTTASEGTSDTGSTGAATTGTSDATTDAPDATESTGVPAAECGNGVLEEFGPAPEECDDGNLAPDDGCSDTCAVDVRVFVTSATYQAGELQSLYLADALCANLADDQGLPDAIKYRAWLSDSTTDARDRFTRGRGRLVMVNGLVLAQSWSALLAGELLNNFEVTEKSTTVHDAVWTGTRPDGTAVPGAEHCDDWSTSSFLKKGHYGYSDRTTPEWTLSEGDDNPGGCNINFALYCLQSL